jgi:hypothetical protein
MLILAQALLALGGLAALCLAMPRHHADALGQRPEPRRRAWLRGLGWSSLALALIAGVLARGWARGSLLGLGLATLAAAVVVLVGSSRPRWIPPLCLASAAGSVLLGLALIA